MAGKGAAGLDAVRRLLQARQGDPLYGDLYLRRAAELLRPHLDADSYAGLRDAEASIAEASRESQVALLRGEWARVKELAGRVDSLRRARAARGAEMELGQQIYGAPEIPIDPFSPGFGPLFGGSAEALARKRDDLVAALAALEQLDPPWREHYAARRAAFQALTLSVEEGSRKASRGLDPALARREALAALDKGDVDAVMRMADAMLEKGADAEAGPSAAGATAAARVGAPLPPFPDPVVAKARPLGLAHEVREPNLEGTGYLRAIAWSPLFPGDEAGGAESRRVMAPPPGVAAAPEAARQLLDQFAIHPYVNSLGIRYMPPLEAEWVLVEDFPEEPPVPERSPLLEALGLASRRGLSRARIERALRERGPAVLEQLGLDLREDLLVCIPADIYVQVGGRRGFGKQPQWTHFDGYQVMRDGTLRPLVGGDARFGGIFDVCSIARDDERPGVVARFAVVRRTRMRTPSA